jgi:CUG-BP- and ETR3-like factor
MPNKHKRLCMTSIPSQVLVDPHKSSLQSQPVGVCIQTTLLLFLLPSCDTVRILTAVFSLTLSLVIADPENKLFVGMLSRKAGEMEVRELFEPFGEIREIYMIRNADGTSKCAAFLRYVMRAAAVQAIESLHNNIVMDGSARPLIVKFADNKHQRQQRQVRNMRRQELLATMPNGYPPYQIQPPMAMPGPHNGSLQYPIPPQYAGAYGTPPPTPPHGPYSAGTATPPSTHGAPPHGVYGAGTLPQPHAYGTLPQQPQQQVGGPPHGAYGAGTHPQPHAQYGAGAPPLPPQGGHPQHHGHTHPQHHHPYMYPTHHQQFGPVPPFAYQNQNRQDTRPSNPRPREGPAGANLFVYHLPHDLTDADLATAFNPFGNVISAKVYVDKFTGESKGFGKSCRVVSTLSH